MIQLEEWQHHIAKNEKAVKSRHEHVSWCGVACGREWHYLEADHAHWSLFNEDRMQPCPACLKILFDLLKVKEGELQAGVEQHHISKDYLVEPNEQTNLFCGAEQNGFWYTSIQHAAISIEKQLASPCPKCREKVCEVLATGPMEA